MSAEPYQLESQMNLFELDTAISKGFEHCLSSGAFISRSAGEGWIEAMYGKPLDRFSLPEKKDLLERLRERYKIHLDSKQSQALRNRLDSLFVITSQCGIYSSKDEATDDCFFMFGQAIEQMNNENLSIAIQLLEKLISKRG